MHDFLQFKVFQSCLNQHFVQSGDPLNVRNIERIRARHWHGIVHGLKKKNANLLQMPGGSKKRHVRHVDLFRSRIKHAARVLSLSRVYLRSVWEKYIFCTCVPSWASKSEPSSRMKNKCGSSKCGSSVNRQLWPEKQGPTETCPHLPTLSRLPSTSCIIRLSSHVSWSSCCVSSSFEVFSMFSPWHSMTYLVHPGTTSARYCHSCHNTPGGDPLIKRDHLGTLCEQNLMALDCHDLVAIRLAFGDGRSMWSIDINRYWWCVQFTPSKTF